MLSFGGLYVSADVAVYTAFLNNVVGNFVSKLRSAFATRSKVKIGFQTTFDRHYFTQINAALLI
jgi:regulator of PEP synthase PpsR (kinase-PPPase family)